ncbi:hypothetical protein AAHC03_016828 [Spirometra sp. Aus1]
MSNAQRRNEANNGQGAIAPGSGRSTPDRSHPSSVNGHAGCIDSDDSEDDSYAPEFPQESEVGVEWFRARDWDPYPGDTCTAPKTCTASQLRLLDRSHNLGDIVRDARSPRHGTVTRSHIRAHAKVVGWNAVLLDIDCSNLRPCVLWDSSYSSHIVRYGDFIGSVVDHELHYILRFSDGARIRVHETAVNCFKLREAIPTDWSGDEFYEGTVISGDARSLAYRAPEAIVRWNTADSKSTSGKTPNGEEVDFLPFFLNETPRHNAIWLAGLRRRTKVDLLVEELIPIRAKFHLMEMDVKDIGGGRPSTILGNDVRKLQSVHPYPWSFCSVRDIFQYTIRPEDKLYDVAHFGNMEGLFYRHMTGQDLTSAQFDVASTQSFSQAEENTNRDPRSRPFTDGEPKASTVSSKPSPYHVPLNVQRTLFRQSRPRFSLDMHSPSKKRSRRVRSYRSLGVCPQIESGRSSSCSSLSPSPSGSTECRPHAGRDTNDKGTATTAERKDVSSRPTHQHHHHQASHRSNVTAPGRRRADMQAEESGLANSTNGCQQALLPQGEPEAVQSGCTPRLTSDGGFPRPPLTPGQQVPVLIIAMETSYDVRWQDGTVEHKVQADALHPEYLAPDENLLMPGDVVRLRSETQEHSSGANGLDGHDTGPNSCQVKSVHSYGVVTSVNSREMICSIQWFEQYLGALKPLGPPEDAGVYEVVIAHEPRYNIGDIVLASTEVDGCDRNVVGCIDESDPSTGLLKLLDAQGTRTDVFPLQCIRVLADDDYEDASYVNASSVDLDLTSDDFDNELYGDESDSSEWETVSNVSLEPKQGLTAATEDADGKAENWTPTDEVRNLCLSRWLLISDCLQEILRSVESLTFLFDALSTNAEELPHLVDAGSFTATEQPGSVCRDYLYPLHWSLRWYLTRTRDSAGVMEALLRGIYCQFRDFRLRKMLKMALRLRQLINSQSYRKELFKCSCSSQQAHRDKVARPVDEVNARIIARLKEVNFVSETGADLGELIPCDFTWPVVIRQTCRYVFLERMFSLVNDIYSLFSAWMSENKDGCPRFSYYGPRVNEPKENGTKAHVLEDGSAAAGPEEDTARRKEKESGSPPLEQVLETNEAHGDAKDPADRGDNALPNGTPEPILEIPSGQRGLFVLEDEAQPSHAFYSAHQCRPKKAFLTAWQRDNDLLSTSLPKGIVVKAFANRMDLFSVMIVGPSGTPYEDGLFFFDLRLTPEYPNQPPEVHYHSLTPERINPNLYVEGRVCLSLLGTWKGHSTENWSSDFSNLLQVLVSLQGLILNAEPFFNEAGYDAVREKSESHGLSRAYNEGVVANLLQSMVQLLRRPLPAFREEIVTHFREVLDSYSKRLRLWATLDEGKFASIKQSKQQEVIAAAPSVGNVVAMGAEVSPAAPKPPSSPSLPEFPLAPVSKGFCISVNRHLSMLEQLVASAGDDVNGQ